MGVHDLEAATREPPERVLFRVRRYDPERGEVWWSEYWVECRRGMTVLDALLQIKSRVDSTLAFRYSCRMGICGSCGVVVNGAPRLACQTQVAEVASRDNPVVVVEPLYNFPVIRDLVVDYRVILEKLRVVKPFLIRRDLFERENPESQYIVMPEDFLDIYEYTLCINCGLCYTACPVTSSDPEYLGPQALAYAARYILDVRDEGVSERIEIVDTEHGCHRCHYAGSCSIVCPKVVDPAQAIQRLRGIVFRYRLGLWRKKTAKPEGKAGIVTTRRKLPKEAILLEGVSISELESKPVVVEVDGAKINVSELIVSRKRRG